MNDRSKVELSWRNKSAAKGFQRGISLHSHTMHSKERLGFLPKITKRVPGFPALFRHIEEKYRRTEGQELDYNRVYWTPPLSAQEAWRVEKDQIESRLNLESFVSISDHDTIEANARLQLVNESQGTPFSVEWTVPYPPAVFHIGVHNLPAHEAESIMDDLAGYTRDPRPERLKELLAMLETIPEVLIVLNHPFSDEGRIGNPIHEGHMKEFVEQYGQWLHALELNAMQPWPDNVQVARVARELGFPVISGGDRHACEPNGNVNLTNAATFSEFVAEVREGISNVLFMPQCREPIPIRYMESIWSILREYPERTERRFWNERVYYCGDDGVERPLVQVTDGGGVARVFARCLRVFGFLMGPRMRPALRLAVPKVEEVVF